MIYIFDKTQAIIKVLTNDDFTAAHLNFKINTATTFEFSLPASKALPSGSKYVATPHPLDDSKFIMLRLTERVDNTETIDYSAYELAYQELATDGYIEDKRPQNQSALNLMKIALDGSNWELNNVNVSGTATTNFYYVDRLSAISKVVDLLGGEIVFYIEIQGNAISGRYMDYLARQGADTSKVFASGSNLLTVERQSDTSNIYTAILPRGKGEEIDNGEADTPDGYGRRINIADVEWKKSAGKPLDKPKGSIVLSDPDATAEWGQINGNARLLLQTYDDIDDVNVLINSAYKTLQSVNHPQIQYSATVADVGGLSLGDTVLIMHGDRDLSYKTRVFEVKYDLLSPDQTELSLGDDLSSNSITSHINNLNAVADTTSSQTQWTINQIGRPSTTFGNTEPANPKVGDVFFKELPDGGTKIHRWNGNIWELLASPTTADDIAKAVNDAVSQAKSHTDEVKQVLSSDIATAKSQAASLANAAEANAKSEAVSQFNRAQNALSDAKADLTKSIASEASQAVAAANSQAQNYVNQAKSDALNTIAKEVTDRQNAVSALDTKATKAVNQAKSDITDTINALSVGGKNLILGTEKDTTWTADSANNWSYKVIATGLKPNQTYTFSAEVTLLGNTDQKNITLALFNAPIEQRLVSIDNFKADDTRNHWTFTVPSTVDSPTASLLIYAGTSGSTGGKSVTFHHIKLETGNIPTDWTQAPEDVVLDYTTKDNKIKETITQYQETNDGKVSKAQTDATTALGQVATKVSQTDYDKKTGNLSTKYTQVKQTVDSQATDIVDIKKTATSQDSKINSISSDVDGTKQSISDIKKTQDSQSDKVNQITNDVNGTKQSITDIQTKDGKQDTRMGTIETSVSGINSDFSSYKTTNDGVVKTAQTTAQTAVDGLKNKVSQTDYDKKTGQLQTDLTTTTKTANQAKTDIASIKQKDGEQDEKMNTIVSDANGTKQTVSDLKTSQDKQSGYISTLKQRADGFDATVTKVNNLSVGGRNLLLGTATPWNIKADDNNWNYNSIYDHLKGGTTYTFSAEISVSNGQDSVSVIAFDYQSRSTWAFSDIFSKGVKRGSFTFTTPDHTDNDGNLLVYAGTREHTAGLSATYTHMKLEEGNVPTAWTPAPEDTVAAIAQVKITADGINNFVRDSSGNISSDFQTALSKTSIITGSTLASSIQKQTSSQISSAITDNNGKIISLINQDSSGVQIAGKNLAITADTTVDGNFWAKQVNAVRVNATNITAGTLNASDVNIINLDVNSLTGNVSNFIQSNWNGEFGSVSIDPFGMTVSTFGVTTEFSNTGMSLRYANELAGGIGVQGWENMPSDYQGLHISLNGVGDFMSFGARDNGVQTGLYTSKLAWMRGAGYARPIGMSSGWTFMDDVKFDDFILPSESSNQKMVLGTTSFNGNDYPYFGDSRKNAGLAYGSSQTYLISDNEFYNLTSVIKAFNGIGAIKIPKEISSDGTVARWTSVSI
ncbi:phage tail spike protein [Leuconostoc mesenteroides]|uniref:phage tail spike protein n=1 Tax=Leuconostoc mesenteroides TaxID=1245 RepID=UPI00388826CC